MTTTRQAALILAERDPVLGELVRRTGFPRSPFPVETPLASLVRGITYQQIGGAAASAIHGRLLVAVGGEVTPERLLALDDATLRAVGMSQNKVLAIRDLAAKAGDGSIELSRRRLTLRSDEDIIAQLSTVRGVGPWSAQMFLIFQLGRLDVWPTGDLAVRKGFGAAWRIPAPSAKELVALGEPYRPYRSVLAWYCWEAARLYAGAVAPTLGAVSSARDALPGVAERSGPQIEGRHVKPPAGTSNRQQE